MRSNPLLRDILNDEALTRGLGDAEARVLVEWLVDQAEELAETARPETAAHKMQHLSRRGRAIAHFVRLWCLDQAYASALQLAATQRFPWPMPDTTIDACELMQEILFWESSQGQDADTQAA